MKQFIIIVLLLYVIHSNSQSTQIEVQIDPVSSVKEEGINLTVAVTTNQLISKTLFRLGALVELFPKIDYYGTHLTFDYPLTMFADKLVLSTGIELGFIFRDNVPNHVHDLKQGDSWAYYTSFGLNLKSIYWITDNIGITARVNSKTRPDILHRWGEDADSFRHSGYVGIVIPINKSKDRNSEYKTYLF